MRWGWKVLACSVLSLAQAPVLRGAPPAQDLDPEALAPRGCWAMSAGCAGRTGRAATPSLRGAVTPAWSWTVPDSPGGEIAEEPRVWKDEVYVSLQIGVMRVALVALDLTTGRPLAPPLEFVSGLPLDPCVTEQGVFVRPEDDTFRLVRVVAGRWVTLWDSGLPGREILSHLASEGRLHALTTSAFVTWSLPSLSILWRAEGAYRGRLAVNQGNLLALTYDEAGNASLGRWSVDRGELGPAAHLGHHGVQSPPASTRGTQIAARGAEAYVQHASAMVAGADRLRTSLVTGGQRSGLYDLEALPVAAPTGWLLYSKDQGVAALRHSKSDAAGKVLEWELAAEPTRPEFCRPQVPITVVADTAWIEGRAFDIESRRVVCRLAEPTTLFRPVPAQGHLLTVPAARRLLAWRSASAPLDGPWRFGALAAPGADAGASAPLVGIEGRVLFADASAYVGVCDLDPVAGTVVMRPAKGKPTTRPLSDALVVLQGADRLLMASSLAWLERHVVRLGRFAARELVTGALKTASASRDPDLVAEVVREALLRGATDKDLATARREEASLRERALKPYEPKVAETRKRLAEAAGPTPAQVLAILASVLDDPRPVVRAQILRLVLTLDAQHAQAAALVRAALPAHLVVPEPFVAADWIDAREVLAGIATHPVEPPPEGARPLTPGERELGAARAYWRPDLVGLASDQLLIMTPLKAPGQLAECLALGELVCTALEDVFSTGAHVRKSRWPLLLQLFATEEEYRKYAVGGGAPHQTQAWSAGHYDPQAGISRIYVPAGDDRLDDVRRVYAHELTHHWIDERCPLFESREAKATARDVTWIVEGMAEMVESFEWNVPGRTWTTFAPDAQVLDLAAHGPVMDDWTAFFDITYEQFQRLDRTLRHEVVLRSELGTKIKLSPMTTFYALSGTVCLYLYHAGPQQRQALLNYVRDAYTGKVAAGTNHIREHFGMSPTELGAAAVAWAGKVVRGEIRAEAVHLR